ncbi:MAG: hypothetical protein WBE77_15860 [Candidatus Cybelea sp.]
MASVVILTLLLAQVSPSLLQAAKISKYRPKVVDCEPVEGAATFWGTWRPGPPL